ncbi:hypothetical protein SUGI_1076850 [Cryptomeria japonica]|uniref:uncharacterized protein LOC131040477 n=1 Tax=Cryptomeria japonica TaxID=3369 RepID=UPI002414B3E8|nr:uncharacterized protein LOC131040477 [Cryptomeria japonica]GLJ50541.1 hypothetical protein SUGI_1076850 [Cryptomeria japonica]
MVHLGRSWQIKMSIIVLMAVAILAVMSEEENVKNTVEQVVEKKEEDGKQSPECMKGTVSCTWDKVKSFSNSAFQRIPSVKKTGEVVTDSVSKSYEQGKGSAVNTGEKIKHSFGPEEL